MIIYLTEIEIEIKPPIFFLKTRYKGMILTEFCKSSYEAEEKAKRDIRLINRKRSLA